MSRILKARTAEAAIRKIWEDLHHTEYLSLPDEAREALAAHSDGPRALTEEVIETAKQAFYAVWELLDASGYSRRTWVEEEGWSGWQLPDELPKLKAQAWQPIAGQLRQELPSNERLEHWAERLFWVGFNTVLASPGHLSFALNAQWELASSLLDRLRELADLVRGTNARLADADPLEDVDPNSRFVFRRQADMIVIRAFDHEHRFERRREPLGLQFIERVLKCPGHALGTADLVGGPPISQQERDNRLESLWQRGYDAVDEETTDTPPQVGFSRPSLVDMETVQAVHTRMVQLRERYDRAKADVDLAAQERVSKERKQLTTYLKQVVHQNTGHLRAFRDNRARALRRTLGRAYASLEEAGLGDLANHCRRHIRMRECTLAYDPPDGVHWLF